jgi:D-glycero-D-manno-heptose 1,7-bisphosphate phosphatase
MGGTPGVILDRDGTLIREVGYLTRFEQIEILPNVPEAIKILRHNGLKVAVVTNQSAVGRGLITEEGLQSIHREMETRLARTGAFLDGIYYCPHHPTEAMGSYRIFCDCRKPNTGLVKKAADELNLDVEQSYVVGDQVSDMELAADVGAKGIRILSDEPWGANRTDPLGSMIVRDLWEAAQWIVHDLIKKGGNWV